MPHQSKTSLYSLLSGTSWRLRPNDSNTDNFSPRLFLAPFLLCSTFLTLLTKCCLSAAGWMFTQRNGDLRWTNPRLGWIWLLLDCWDHFSSEATITLTTDHDATSNDIITFCDIWQFVWQKWPDGNGGMTEQSWWVRNLQHAPTVSPPVWWRPRLSRQGWREAVVCHLGKISGSKALEHS